MARSTRSGRDGEPAPHYSAQDVRGGEIILRNRRNRLIFIGGLAASALAALVLGILSLG